MNNGSRLTHAIAFGILMSAILFGGGSLIGSEKNTKGTTMKKGKNGKATFGGGCFWCIEAVYEQIEGVLSVTSGYAGGTKPDPTYEQVCSGRTGHAEVVQIDFDPDRIGYEELLEIFWKAHDPTTPNRQGADAGTQYRSIILYHDEAQRAAAEKSKRELEASGRLKSPVVTEIKPLEAFYAAEDYHQGYYAGNPGAGYCRVVIGPKLKKLGLKVTPPAFAVE
jgi:peptide-methionine (S)-S-oxide reductase